MKGHLPYVDIRAFYTEFGFKFRENAEQKFKECILKDKSCLLRMRIKEGIVGLSNRGPSGRSHVIVWSDIQGVDNVRASYELQDDFKMAMLKVFKNRKLKHRYCIINAIDKVQKDDDVDLKTQQEFEMSEEEA
ncbi:hypothetical protein INT47_002456 [Mucor saturninus]|uniref:Uncharacterized protein n=1 Tax=Mucor saturninus TaxID=64648 RepID=A0A8H7RGE4_9FUNG|nr:hypothetical protein INT47_002456 [Mucor saturninus]